MSDRVRPGVIRYRFVPHIGRDFKFRSVTIRSDLGRQRLVVIE